jgi:hypothetical protein
LLWEVRPRALFQRIHRSSQENMQNPKGI